MTLGTPSHLGSYFLFHKIGRLGEIVGFQAFVLKSKSSLKWKPYVCAFTTAIKGNGIITVFH